MNAEFIAMLDYLERERGIKREILLEAVSNALLSASKKSVSASRELRIDINPKTGEIRALANLIVADKVTNPQDEISETAARRIKSDAKVGDVVEVEVTPKNFGRIAGQTAKQAMMQRIRQVEKEMIYEEFKDRAGEIVSGTVRRFDRSDVILDLGKFEAIMPQRERVVVEDYNVGDRLRAYVVAVDNGIRGPEIIVSRSHPNFVRRLFELEVSEIADGTVEIRGIAREAGYRTKIAVWSANEKVDPVGACVGMRGSRVKNIVRELNNEKVDIIRWSSDPKEYVLEALKPAKVKNLVFDTEKKSVQISVDEDQLSLAIGKKGQNARLTSRLTGWEINIGKDTSATTVVEQKLALAAQKTKVLKKEPKRAPEHADAAAPAKSCTLAPKTEPRPAAAPSHEHESVSLIDRKKPRKKTEDGEVKPKRNVLPPISRIRASMEATVAPPKPAAPVEASKQTPPSPAPSEVVPPSAEAEVAPQKIILIKPPIVVKQLAAELGLKPHQLIAELMTHNIFANMNQTIEPDIAAKIAENHGFVLEKERREKGAGVHKVEQVVVAPPPPVIEKNAELKPRGPIITFMGHVDHGKTSVLDAIRKTRVAAGEAGGITQHIGAHTVDHNGATLTFIDTPGHAAFTAMRARGANVTDIVVLVVAADDGIMPQTLEAINHAKAAPHVKIMVAINKIDLPSANIDRVKKQLQEHELTPEDWGGETIVCPVSATKGTGIDHLLEMMTLQAEVMELKASPTATPRGTVIEAQVEAGRGPTATVIVQMGTLKVGDPFICGDYSGKVKSLLDDRGQPIKKAGPSTPVKVLGFTGLPNAGDELLVMDSERSAKTLSEERLLAKRAYKLTVPQRATPERLLEAADGKKVLRIVLKCDAQGSLEALIGALQQIESKKIDLEIIHSAVGPISESDILLASASNAVVVGFNVKVENMAVSAARQEGVQVNLDGIIYELLDQIKEAMAGLLEPEHRETVIGHAEVKQVFELSRGIVAGCLVTEGRIARAARARVLRKRQPVYDGGISTLRRFQDDVKEVRSGLECGIKLGDFSEYQVGDIIECYQLEAIAQKL